MPQAAQQSFACFSFSVHFFFFPRNKKEKMNNNLHNLCMWSIDAHNMGYVNTGYSVKRQNVTKYQNNIVYTDYIFML